MRLFLVLSFTVFAAACNAPATHVNAYTLEECEPSASFMPKQNQGNGAQNDKCQGTSNGDNCDDLSSGKVDCIGDGNSGQGDDKKHMCDFPQPGCDDQGCCDEDVVEPPGDGDDDGGGDPPPPPPPPPDDTQPPPDGETEPPPGSDGTIL